MQAPHQFSEGGYGHRGLRGGKGEFTMYNQLINQLPGQLTLFTAPVRLNQSTLKPQSNKAHELSLTELIVSNSVDAKGRLSEWQ